MNTTASTALQPGAEQQGIASAAAAATRPFYWAVRRELWEYRSLYIAPLAVGGVALVGLLYAMVSRVMKSNVEQMEVLKEPYSLAAGLIMAAAFLVGFFYCLDSLHGERRDRSILFWKSLPVSDLTTVLAKASIAIVFVPLLAFVVTFVLQWMLLLSSAVLLKSGVSAALWKQLPEFQEATLYHLVTVHVLWYAPLYAWMMLVSAWARRATFLWAGLPPLAIGVAEKIAFNTRHFANLMGYRFAGPEHFDMTEPGQFVMDPMMHLHLGTFLRTPGLYTGLVIAALLLAAAVRLRRHQGPI